MFQLCNWCVKQNIKNGTKLAQSHQGKIWQKHVFMNLAQNYKNYGPFVETDTRWNGPFLKIDSREKDICWKNVLCRTPYHSISLIQCITRKHNFEKIKIWLKISTSIKHEAYILNILNIIIMNILITMRPIFNEMS